MSDAAAILGNTEKAKTGIDAIMAGRVRAARLATPAKSTPVSFLFLFFSDFATLPIWAFFHYINARDSTRGVSSSSTRTCSPYHAVARYSGVQKTETVFNAVASIHSG